MKRLVAGLTIIGLIIVLGVAGLIYTDSYVDKLIGSLETAREDIALEEYEQAKSICEEAFDEFEEKERLFSLFLNHGLLERIKEDLNGLPDYATKETKAAFLSTLEKVKTNLIELKDSQKHIF